MFQIQFLICRYKNKHIHIYVCVYVYTCIKTSGRIHKLLIVYTTGMLGATQESTLPIYACFIYVCLKKKPKMVMNNFSF